MKLISNGDFARQMIDRYTTFLSIAAPSAEMALLEPSPSLEHEERGKVIRQEIQEIHNCIEQNTIVNLELNLQMVNQLVKNAVLHLVDTNIRAEKMVAHQIVLEKEPNTQRIRISADKVKSLKPAPMVSSETVSAKVRASDGKTPLETSRLLLERSLRHIFEGPVLSVEMTQRIAEGGSYRAYDPNRSMKSTASDRVSQDSPVNFIQKATVTPPKVIQTTALAKSAVYQSRSTEIQPGISPEHEQEENSATKVKGSEFKSAVTTQGSMRSVTEPTTDLAKSSVASRRDWLKANFYQNTGVKASVAFSIEAQMIHNLTAVEAIPHYGENHLNQSKEKTKWITSLESCLLTKISRENTNHIKLGNQKLTVEGLSSEQANAKRATTAENISIPTYNQLYSEKELLDPRRSALSKEIGSRWITDRSNASFELLNQGKSKVRTGAMTPILSMSNLEMLHPKSERAQFVVPSITEATRYSKKAEVIQEASKPFPSSQQAEQGHSSKSKVFTKQSLAEDTQNRLPFQTVLKEWREQAKMFPLLYRNTATMDTPSAGEPSSDGSQRNEKNVSESPFIFTGSDLKTPIPTGWLQSTLARNLSVHPIATSLVLRQDSSILTPDSDKPRGSVLRSLNRASFMHPAKTASVVSAATSQKTVASPGVSFVHPQAATEQNFHGDDRIIPQSQIHKASRVFTQRNLKKQGLSNRSNTATIGELIPTQLVHTTISESDGIGAVSPMLTMITEMASSVHPSAMKSLPQMEMGSLSLSVKPVGAQAQRQSPPTSPPMVLRTQPKSVENSQVQSTTPEGFDIPTVRTVSSSKKVENKNENIAINAPQVHSVQQLQTAVAVSDSEIHKIADKVYRTIETRLRNEKIRRGMW